MRTRHHKKRSNTQESTTTPLSGSTNIRPVVGVGVAAVGAAGGVAPGAAAAAAVGPNSRNHCPSPLPLDERLGVSPHEEGSPLPDLGDADAAAEVRRALNNDGRRCASRRWAVRSAWSSLSTLRACTRFVCLCRCHVPTTPKEKVTIGVYSRAILNLGYCVPEPS